MVGRVRAVHIIIHCKGWEIHPALFIFPYAAMPRYLADAGMLFSSFGTCFSVEQVRKIIWCPQGNLTEAGLYWWLCSQRIHLKDYDPLSEAVQCYALQISWRKKSLCLSPKQKNHTYRQIFLYVIRDLIVPSLLAFFIKYTCNHCTLSKIFTY